MRLYRLVSRLWRRPAAVAPSGVAATEAKGGDPA
jgi:hypothetical protein